MARRAERKRPRGRTSRSELQRRNRARKSPDQARKATCPVVVGMGASAGGLEAFIRFFRTMPPDSGMAFVVIQHLDPTHESLTAELLGKHTKMPVRQVAGDTPVERDLPDAGRGSAGAGHRHRPLRQRHRRHARPEGDQDGRRYCPRPGAHHRST
ncbi:MAG: hypothetical protein DME03_10715 [Candidatus Rokuibacteriota bacterium]|nr:MAG: hypothetical protein DME03_10715 [Candidatus Rokubacteria bacterium]